MDSSQTAVLVPMWGLMTIWLGFVAISVIVAFKKWQKTEDLLKKQMFYLWCGGTLVFIGDSLHTVAFTLSIFTGDPTGPINVFGATFEFRTFAMFFDALVFMIYYALWALFIVVRYQQGQFASYDKISFSLAMAAIVLILPGAVPNALGIYTLNYNIAIWAPHMIFFVIFGVMTVLKLIRCARHALTHTSNTVIQTQERALSIAGVGFAFSFLFFTLFLIFVTLTETTGFFMILKTFAYMLAFFYLIKGVLIPTPTKA